MSDKTIENVKVLRAISDLLSCANDTVQPETMNWIGVFAVKVLDDVIKEDEK